jgi:Tfp pilus assembly protein PilO
MIVYAICLTINVLGMGFLFYIHEQQKLLNTEFLKNAIISNAVLDMLKEKTEELERLVKDLENQKK